MKTEPLHVQVSPAEALTAAERAEIVTMCYHAYEEDLEALYRAYQEDPESLYRTFPGVTHVTGRLRGALVSHAMWVTRWLQVGDGPLLRTAYVEMVATDPAFQGRGYATSVMSHLATAIENYDLGGLSPADTTLYSRLGWAYWRGPRSIRGEEGPIPTPEERVMVLRLPGTPPLDLDAPLSAEWREGELW